MTYKHYSLDLTANMQQLLDDPETLPFKKDNHISLRALKKEIDRRIAKIRAMLGDHQIPWKFGSKKINVASQTHLPLITTILEDQNEKALTSNSSIINSDHEKTQQVKRSSLPLNKTKHKKQETMDCSHHKNKTKLSEYISGAKSKDDYSIEKMGNNGESESEEGKNVNCFVHTAQDNKIFQSQDFENFVGRPSHTMQIPFDFDNSNQFDEISDSDSQKSIIYHKRLSNIGLKARSLKKIRFTDRTAPESENRIVVSQDCMDRMQVTVDQLVTKKRRELRDNKIRENIIKKIDEKYGDYVSF